MKTYGTNYNGLELWVRVYLPHGQLATNAANIGKHANDLLVNGQVPNLPLSQWRIDYNQNGIYFEARITATAEHREQLEELGFKASKNAS